MGVWAYYNFGEELQGIRTVRGGEERARRLVDEGVEDIIYFFAELTV